MGPWAAFRQAPPIAVLECGRDSVNGLISYVAVRYTRSGLSFGGGGMMGEAKKDPGRQDPPRGDLARSVDKLSIDTLRNDALSRQYQIYVEMTESLVARRAEANRFYLSINTALIAMLGFVFDVRNGFSAVDRVPFIVLVAGFGVILCLVWAKILSSHRRLMRKKFHIVHVIERQLPIQPYTDELMLENNGGAAKIGVSRYERILPNLLLLGYALVAVLGSGELAACYGWVPVGMLEDLGLSGVIGATCSVTL